jgi:hypothetical protein
MVMKIQLPNSKKNCPSNLNKIWPYFVKQSFKLTHGCLVELAVFCGEPNIRSSHTVRHHPFSIQFWDHHKYSSSSRTRVHTNTPLRVCAHECVRGCEDGSRGKTTVCPALPCLHGVLFSRLKHFSALKMEAEDSSVTFVPLY